jgi:uncharacterized protein YlxW (UPF0749 family)
MFRKRDIYIFTIISILVGFFIVRQYQASREVKILSQPENNQVIALEVAKLTKVNAELRREIIDSEGRVNNYQKSVGDWKTKKETLDHDLKLYEQINGLLPISGRGIILDIGYKLDQPQEVDIANTIRNIGVDGFSINGRRVGINYHFDGGFDKYEFQIIGNPTLVRSALTRKGGFLDQLFPTGVEYSITESDQVNLATADPLNFTYSKIIN